MNAKKRRVGQTGGHHESRHVGGAQDQVEAARSRTMHREGVVQHVAIAGRFGRVLQPFYEATKLFCLIAIVGAEMFPAIGLLDGVRQAMSTSSAKGTKTIIAGGNLLIDANPGAGTPSPRTSLASRSARSSPSWLRWPTSIAWSAA